jgi:hypothetical protein
VDSNRSRRWFARRLIAGLVFRLQSSVFRTQRRS